MMGPGIESLASPDLDGVKIPFGGMADMRFKVSKGKGNVSFLPDVKGSLTCRKTSCRQVVKPSEYEW